MDPVIAHKSLYSVQVPVLLLLDGDPLCHSPLHSMELHASPPFSCYSYPQNYSLISLFMSFAVRMETITIPNFAFHQEVTNIDSQMLEQVMWIFSN